MKYALLLFLAEFLAGQTILAQNKVDGLLSICGSHRVIASVKGKSYYLQLDNGKKQKIGNKLTKDSALTAYRNALNGLLAKACNNSAYDQSEFVLFVNSFAHTVVGKFFPPPVQASLVQSYPLLIDSIPLDATHFLGVIRTTKDSMILSIYGATEVHDVFRWDSSGKQVSFDLSVFNGDVSLKRYLPQLLSLQTRISKTAYPQFYLLYDGDVPDYELISSTSAGVGTDTRISIPAATGDTIKVAGKETALTIGDRKLNVQPVRTTTVAKPVNAAIAAGSGKGSLIEHQQVPDRGASSFNIAAYVYEASPSDSILVSLRSPGHQVPDTAFPADFSVMELENWVNGVLPIPNGGARQRDSVLSDFVSKCWFKIPFLGSAYESLKQKNAPAEANAAAANDAVPAAKEVPAAAGVDAGKKDPAQASSDTTKKGSSGKSDTTDSLAKYSVLNNITLLNAANFDFSGKLSTSYLGLLNVFAPDFYTFKSRKKDKETGIGFIAGIEKINYSSANINGNDSSQTAYVYQYVLANPLDYDYVTQKVNPAAKTYYQYNRYTMTSKNTVWSFYFEPTLRNRWIRYKATDPKVGFYWHSILNSS